MKRTNTAQWIESRSRWQINVQKDGIRKTFASSTPGRAGQRECNAKADRWLDEGVENARIKVKEASDLYLEHIKETTSTSNYNPNKSYFKNWINPTIGMVKVESLTEQHLQSVIDKAHNKGLSKKTLQDIRGCMTSFLKYCRKAKYTSLVTDDLEIPKGAKVGERTILKPSDIKTLFNEDTTLFRGKEIHDPFIYAYRFHVFTGLRPGELFGLKWEDVADGKIILKRSINSHNEITTGKNDNARRDFSLNIFTSALINNQKALLSELGISSEYIFCDKWGEPLKTQHYYDRWKAYRDYHKFEEATPYELRHTFVSAVKTLPEGYLKQLVGHSKDMDTYGVYSHQMAGEKEKIAVMVQEIFKSIIAG